MPNQKTTRAGVAAGGVAELATRAGSRGRTRRVGEPAMFGALTREPSPPLYVHVLLVIYLTKPHRQGAPLRHHTVTNYDLQVLRCVVLILDNIALGGHVDAIQELTDVLVLHRADLLDESAATHKGARLSWGHKREAHVGERWLSPTPDAHTRSDKAWRMVRGGSDRALAAMGARVRMSKARRPAVRHTS